VQEVDLSVSLVRGWHGHPFVVGRNGSAFSERPVSGHFGYQLARLIGCAIECRHQKTPLPSRLTHNGNLSLLTFVKPTLRIRSSRKAFSHSSR
jgi:hypothetical protein